jgi:uncharacterized protein (TIGR03067 family)
MRPNLQTILAAVFTLCVACQGSVQAQDIDKMQGTWKVTYAANKDRVANKDQMAAMTVIIDKNKFTYMDNTDPKNPVKEVVLFSLKSGAQPYKVIEFKRGRDDKELHWHGIYEFSAGKIKMCWGAANRDRPKSFNPRDDQRVYTLERPR